MAATPEEFLFVDPEPPSPSVFLDLPPTPHGHDPAAFDDMALPYISRLLMEEEDIGEDNFFYQYPDHPVLLQAQLPFAQILSDVATTTTTSNSNAAPDSPDTTDSTFPGAGCSSDSDRSVMASSAFVKPIFPADNRDMFTSAVLKGMEEASKFLPANSALDTEAHSRDHKLERGLAVKEEVVDGVFRSRKNRHGGDDLEAGKRRASKLMTPGTEEAAAREMFDEMMLHEQGVCMKGVQHLSISADSERVSGKKERREVRHAGALRRSDVVK